MIVVAGIEGVPQRLIRAVTEHIGYVFQILLAVLGGAEGLHDHFFPSQLSQRHHAEIAQRNKAGQ